MQSGKLRYKLTIESPTRSVSDSGQPIITWSTFAQVRGDVRTGSGREFDAHGKANGEQIQTAYCRYIDDVKPEMRVKWTDRSGSDRYINIVDIGEDRTHDRMLIIKGLEDKD